MWKYFTCIIRHYHGVYVVFLGHRQDFFIGRVTRVVTVGKLMEFPVASYNPGQKLLERLRASLHIAPNSISLTIGCTIWERACSCGPPSPYSMLEEKSPFCLVQNPTLIRGREAISKVTLPSQHFCPLL